MQSKCAISVALIFLQAFAHFPETTGQVWLRAVKGEDTYALINSVFGQYGANEMPDCGHKTAHVEMGNDGQLDRAVFFFHAHAKLDDDRCQKQDRQRTEIRPDDVNGLTGRDGDSVSHSWNFKLDAGFQVSDAFFTHLHQLKAVGGDDSLPIITISPKKGGGNPDRMLIGHTKSDGANSALAQVGLTEFLGNWVHVQQEARYGRNGRYHVSITRVSDGKVLLSYTNENIELYREGGLQYIRPKWGIYRSLSDQSNLRDETVRFDSFCIGKNGGHCP